MKHGVSLNLMTAVLIGLSTLSSLKYIYDGKLLAEETLGISMAEKAILQVALIQCRNESDLAANGAFKQREITAQDAGQMSRLKDKFDEEKKNLIKYLSDYLRDSPYPGVENYTRYAAARSGMPPIDNAKPLRPEFGPVVNDVLSFGYPINIPSCPDNISANKSVFIALISAPAHFKQRADIRNTWHVHLKSVLMQKRPPLGMARIGFFLGQTANASVQSRIDEESRKHGDVIQIGMDDSYRNLTLKGVAVLNWVRRHCAKVDLVFKVDDDIYVNVHNLVHFVQSNYQSDNSLFGYGNFGFYPIRMELGYPEDYAKWDLTYEEYPWANYPNYVNGPAYFMHASVILPLLAASQTTPFIPFEDVYLTGMCAEKAGVKMQYSDGNPSVFYRPLPTVPTPCDLRSFVAWPTDNHADTHLAVDDFYRNKTRCVVTESDGTNRTIDMTAPVLFQFNQ